MSKLRKIKELVDNFEIYISSNEYISSNIPTVRMTLSALNIKPNYYDEEYHYDCQSEVYQIILNEKPLPIYDDNSTTGIVFRKPDVYANIFLEYIKFGNVYIKPVTNLKNSKNPQNIILWTAKENTFDINFEIVLECNQHQSLIMKMNFFQFNNQFLCTFITDNQLIMTPINKNQSNLDFIEKQNVISKKFNIKDITDINQILDINTIAKNTINKIQTNSN